jgi:hypothetical protein
MGSETVKASWKCLGLEHCGAGNGEDGDEPRWSSGGQARTMPYGNVGRNEPCNVASEC